MRLLLHQCAFGVWRVQVGDKIDYIKLVDGLENLQRPPKGSVYTPRAIDDY